MAAAILAAPGKTLARVLHELGDIPPERIGLPFGTATEQDLIEALEAVDKRLYELIDGVLVEKAMGFRESFVASLVVYYLWEYLQKRDLGIAFSADGPIRLRPGRVRMPDAGFVSWQRLPGGELPDDPILDAIPDLAIEVISRGNTPKEMDLKLRDYFQAGVRLVWFIYPKTQSAIAYSSLTVKKEIPKDRALEGSKVLPGFSLSLKKLFARSRRSANGRARGRNSK
jgi:Uma2 family endonuclease